MNAPIPIPGTLKRFLVLIGAGLVSSLALPPANLFAIGWVSPALILFLACHGSGKKSFLGGFIAGWVHILAITGWLLNLPVPSMAVAVWLAHGFVHGVVFGIWTAGCWWIHPGWNSAPSRRKVAGWLLFCSAFWILLELILFRLLPSFPFSWAYTQWNRPLLIQLASMGGVYLLSFLIVWVSLTAGEFLRRKAFRLPSLGVGILLPPLIGVMGMLGYGWIRLQPSSSPGAENEIRFTLIQPAIIHPGRWTDLEKTNSFDSLVSLTREALETPTDLILWPEAPIPNFLTRFNWHTFSTITNLVKESKTPILFGSGDFERKSDGSWFSFNSAFLIDASGALVDRYHKRHLVPVGEYVPYLDRISWVRQWLRLDRAYSPGTNAVLFSLQKPSCTFGVLICAEDLYPHEVRDFISEKTSFLVNLTNDSWFGEGAGHWHHFLGSVFRAVEFGRPVIRCANNGISGWIDGRGRVREIFDTPNPYARGYLNVTVPLSASAPTPYFLGGDWFAWICVCAAVVGGGMRWQRRPSKGIKNQS